MVSISVIGYSFKLPDDAVDDAGLWSILQNRKNVKSSWPAARSSVALPQDTTGKSKLRYGNGGHFLKQDPAAFDAPFFSITNQEAASMDPQQRWALEAAYHAFENSGVSMESIRGSKTAVYAGSMTVDMSRIVAKDPDTAPPLAATGISSSLLANRISWFFDLAGPSVQIDTACSSSMVALDLACQSLHNGTSTMALVVGTNVMLSLETSAYLASMNFLSPDGVCYSFDHRANGYGRGEGVVALLLQPTDLAVSAGHTIRAVIRSTGTNQDGKTPGLTQPSAEAQETLIRDVYAKAGLDFGSTRYVEAHGTGTAIGDPTEVTALGRVFKSWRSAESPLYVGSLKANFGHLEGASGLAGVIKAILVLERGIIPPQANFEKLNPAIDGEFYHIKIPTESTAWPTPGLRRVSVNSFGVGGTNSHVVLDDAFHYLRLSFDACNLTSSLVENLQFQSRPSHDRGVLPNGPNTAEHGSPYELLLWSAADEPALSRMLHDYQAYYSRISKDEQAVCQLAQTLAFRRTRFRWRAFAVADMMTLPLQETTTSITKPARTLEKLGACFVFTGQGAQYAGMGLKFGCYPSFAKSLYESDAIFAKLGAEWHIQDVIGDEDKLATPEHSQPICTALQIALVELMKSFGITPTCVLGHSSGEIAAAYAMGALSQYSACKVAYHRGRLAARLREQSAKGAMISVNVSERDMASFLSNGIPHVPRESVTVACINSDRNCTLAADESVVDCIKSYADSVNVFAHKLGTGVQYHSPAMLALTEEYVRLMGSLESTDNTIPVPMVSSVNGKLVDADVLRTAQYWADNLSSQVRFYEATLNLFQQPSLGCLDGATITDIIEVGPHGALQRPLRDILQSMEQDVTPQRIDSNVRYFSTLKRSHDAQRSVLDLLGQLFCRGYGVILPRPSSDNRHRLALVDCPQYPFDHSRKPWHESRLSRNYRLNRSSADSQILGVPSSDWNSLQPSWRTFPNQETMPWLGEHIVSGKALFPGTGMLVMAVEAVKQEAVTGRGISGFMIKEAHFLSPIIVGNSMLDCPEVVLSLRRLRSRNQSTRPSFEASITTCVVDQWTEVFRAKVQIRYDVPDAQVDRGRERRLRDEQILQNHQSAESRCGKPIGSPSFYEFYRKHGLEYGSSFRVLESIRWDGSDTSVAHIRTFVTDHDNSYFSLPITLDAGLHLSMAQATYGLSKPIATSVPHSMYDVWLSAKPVRGPFQVMCKINRDLSISGTRATVSILDGNKSPFCLMGKLRLSAVSHNGTAESSEHKSLLHGIEWLPRLNSLTPSQLNAVCNAGRTVEGEGEMIEYLENVESALMVKAKSVLKSLPKQEGNRPRYIKALIRKLEDMTHTNCSALENTPLEDMAVDLVLQELENKMPDWKIFPVVGRHLYSILMGKTDPLELVFSTQMAETFYSSAFGAMCNERLEMFLNLASHENPSLRILEVGAGTGGFSRHILALLEKQEIKNGGTSYARYDFTDISSSFYERAHEHLKQFGNRIEYSNLDLERDPRDQGFMPASYDLVIAGGVIHATSNLKSAIRHIRLLLRTGGHLINVEMINSQSFASNIGFGVLPGWWNSTESWRREGPLLTETQWDELLRNDGFSGNDVAWQDFKSEKYHMCSLMISTAIDHIAPDTGPTPELILLMDSRSIEQSSLAAAISRSQNAVCLPLESVLKDPAVLQNRTVVSLLQVEAKFLTSISRTQFQLLQNLFRHIDQLLWVACVNEHGNDYSYVGLMDGFLRTIRSEDIQKTVVSLAVEAHGDKLNPTAIATHVSEVIRLSFQASCTEQEYVLRGNQIMTGRLIENPRLSRRLEASITPALRLEAWGDGTPVSLTIATPGMLDSLRFVEDATHVREVGPSEIEVDPQVWPVNFRDVFAALGRLPGEHAGLDTFSPGDRVYVYSPDNTSLIRTFVRCPFTSAIRIPDELSLEAAVAMVNPGATAYHSLVNIAQLKAGEKILIHSAGGATGQVAIMISKMIGAEIYATVGSEDKKKFLVNTYGIPTENIFFSRDDSFSQGIKRVTTGIDVILNSLSGDLLEASWECIAPYGRFIEIGKIDIMEGSSLPMTYFAKNVSFHAIDLHEMAVTKREYVRDLARKIFELSVCNKLSAPTPLQRYPLNRIEDAYRDMQTGRHTGRIQLWAEPRDKIWKSLCDKAIWQFDPGASYLIAGGLGGLGRSITKWMVKRGARNLILLSRSGVSSRSASAMVEELQKLKIKCFTPTCDVSRADALKRTLEDCRQLMPPIKGCINATMVLQDAVFDNMTYEQWETTIRSKVNSSWNLHQMLPSQLDFFILLSSLSGIYGSMAQSNYAAGCTFQDALARHRVFMGKKAVSIDVGWMKTVGIVAENEAYQQNRNHVKDMIPLEEEHLLALLEIYCDPSAPLQSAEESQILIGARTPVDFLAEGEAPILSVQVPLFSRFRQLAQNASMRDNAFHGPEVHFQRGADCGGESRASARRIACFEKGRTTLNLTIAHDGQGIREWIGGTGDLQKFNMLSEGVFIPQGPRLIQGTRNSIALATRLTEHLWKIRRQYPNGTFTNDV
ncbi:fatty acid synthase S-acetyltransferase [Xylariomycetidae sp. FL2044]|nr:fatty acid synthase S-acetyltransferase [Xylariomycetidae sp. FL2044]